MWFSLSPFSFDALTGVLPWLGAAVLLSWGLGGVYLLSRGSIKRSTLGSTCAYLGVFWAAGMLVIFPSGGAVCWTMPSGEHVHIGWVDMAGQETGALIVMHHPVNQPPLAQAGRAASQHGVTSAPENIVIPLLASVASLALPAATVWFHLPGQPFHAQLTRRRPLSPPPRWLVAL